MTTETSLTTRRGRLLLALLCAVAFLDFVDGSIVNVALPDMRRDLHFSLEGLQWVPSGYLLTYGGFMLLGGRLADLLGRRRVLLAGILVVAVSSFVGGCATDAGVLVGSRLAQGLGAALMLPAALSILTTSFRDGRERNLALGVWGGMAGLASAAGVLFGGLLTGGPGWRWVMFVNPVACAIVAPAVLALIERDRERIRLQNFDVLGTLLATGGMIALVYGIAEAPDHGWGSARTLGTLAGGLALIAAFMANERVRRNPLLPLSIFRIRGLVAADVTQLIAVAGFMSMFFFLTLYMQNVLGYSPMRTGLAYLPLCFGVIVAATVTSQLMTRIGTRPLIVSGLLVAAGGMYWLSRIPVDGSFLADLLPPTVVLSIGLGTAFVAITTAANAGVPTDRAGLAAALLNSAQQLGGALGLAVFSALATAHTKHQLGRGVAAPAALTDGFERAFLASTLVLLAAAVLAMRTSNARTEAPERTGPSDANAAAASASMETVAS